MIRLFEGKKRNSQTSTSDAPARRVLGQTFEGDIIFEPKKAGSSITFAGSGGGKTTSVAVPTIQAMLADTDRAIFINDVKDGEIAAQIADMCLKYGRKFGVVDDFGVLGADYPYRLSINPFSGGVTGALNESDELMFINENFAYALVQEPKDDSKNFYWRETPRALLDLGLNVLLRQDHRLATPGGLSSFLNDPSIWNAAIEVEADDETSPLRTASQQALEMRDFNPEHWSQHIQAARTALKIFSSGPLSLAGRNADITHEELLRDKWIVCFVNPARYAERLGAYFALHFLSLLEAQLTGKFGQAEYVLDEYCNAPLKNLVTKITIFRAYGARAHFIAQSRSDSIKQYGEKETQTLIENCSVVQYLKFSSIDEAERVSKAMGETLTINESINYNSDKLEFSGGFNTGKDRLLTANELMSLPDDEQVIYIAGVGWIHCKKIRQNNLAPTCHDLGINPLEGGRLKPHPLVALPVPDLTA